MRIAIDVRALTDERMTGVGVYTFELVKALAEAGPEHEFVLFASGSATVLTRLPNFQAENIKLVTISIPNRILSTLLRLPFGPNLEDFLPEPVDTWIFPKFSIFKTELPYYVTVHDLAFDIFPQFITFKERLYNRVIQPRAIVEAATGVFCVSERTAQDLSLRWQTPAAKITVTPLAVDRHKFSPREQPSDRTFRATYDLNRPYLLALATHEPRKNLEAIVEAFAVFRQQHPSSLPLVLAGTPGWKNTELYNLIEKHPFADDILLLGYVPDKHKAALYRGASCFIFPSFYEGFGLPVLEALACGTPVITSFTSSMPEVTGAAALLIDPFNVNDLAAALAQLISQPESATLRAQLSAAGLKQAAKFSWEQTALATLQAIIRVDQSITVPLPTA